MIDEEPCEVRWRTVDNQFSERHLPGHAIPPRRTLHALRPDLSHQQLRSENKATTDDARVLEDEHVVELVLTNDRNIEEDVAGEDRRAELRPRFHEPGTGSNTPAPHRSPVLRGCE